MAILILSHQASKQDALRKKIGNNPRGKYNSITLQSQNSFMMRNGQIHNHDGKLNIPLSKINGLGKKKENT